MAAASRGRLVIERKLDGHRCIIRLIGDLDRRVAPALLALLYGQCIPSEEIVLDLRQVTSIDASGIGAILDAHNKCAETGGALTATAAGPEVQRVLERVLEITGLQRIGPFESKSPDETAPDRPRAVIQPSPTGGIAASRPS